MGARTLEARLTARLLGLAGAVLVAVGATAVVVTDRVLDAADTGEARAHAASSREALDRELAEGDTPAMAEGEVVTAAEAEGVRVNVLHGGRPAAGTTRPIPAVGPGECASFDDEQGRPWRECGAGDARTSIVTAVPVAAHRHAVGSLARGMVAVVLVALALLWLAVKRALRRPVAELTALVGWTGRIVDTEKAIEPPPSETREIAQLESAFDALVRRLLDALARERANSAHIAHELRTPLTAIVAELDGLKVEDAAARAAIARARGDAARLNDVIDAILVLSSGDRGERADAIVNVADIAREIAPAGVRVDAPDEALVEGDDRLVSLALRNLVDNARKYGGGVDEVRVARQGGTVRVAVIDRGPGLDETARSRMFDRYWRAAADGDGRGLGLALVRAVAERHGGRAEAQPGPEGHGLDVSITLDRLVGWHEDARDGSAEPRTEP
jgi:signal transduction histidine kinase